jgi:hypothetical protein
MVVRCVYKTVRDYEGPAGPLDRAFEIQSISDNGADLVVDLFGSTGNASVESPTTPTTALPDAFYNASGTNLTSVLTIVGDVVQAGTYNITGNANLTNSGAIYYYLGDLTIADGAVINITGNVQLRIRGFLQVNGDISGKGGGLAGVADSGASLLVDNGGLAGVAPATFNTIAGNPGYVGNSRGLDGVQSKAFRGGSHVHTIAPASVIGKHPTAPPLALQVSGNSLLGLPSDLRGSGGAPGGRIAELDAGNLVAETLGGAGANGGAGLCIINRGMAFGASGSINLDGNNAAATTLDTSVGPLGIDVYPGTGGAGAPGALYVLLDGAELSLPSLNASNFSAKCGTVPVNGNPLPERQGNIPLQLQPLQPLVGFLDEGLISGADHTAAALRVRYKPL